MSNFGFGEDDETTEPQGQGEREPAWFRSRMDKVSGEIAELKAENDRLKTAQRQQEVAEALKAKGYAPQAAGLYTGTPDKLDDWLGANSAALARADGAAVEQGQEGVQGTPQTVVTPESQAAQAAFSAAGQNGAPALGTEDQLAARMNAAQTEEEFAAIMREAGNRRF